MKKIALSALALGCIASANAQSVRFGVKGGVNLANSRIIEPIKSDASPLSLGAYGGLLAEVSFKNPGDKFKGQLEVNYDFYNIKNEYGDAKMISRIHAISVPLVAKYFIVPEFSLMVGPTFNFNLAYNESTKLDGKVSDPEDAKDRLKPFQIGAVVGANYYIYRGFFVEARYNYIAAQFEKDNKVNKFGAANNVQVGIGYKF